MAETIKEGEPTHETDPIEAPRIYVASLSDYNAGRLHGRWLNAARPVEDIQTDVQAMLADSREPGAEEYAIHDYDGFGPLRLSEYESLETVSRLGVGIMEHGEAFAAYAFGIDQWTAEQLGRFEDTYRGKWDSLTAYADDLLDDLGATQAIERLPTWLQSYVTLDVAAYARDLIFSADLLTIASADGGVFIFEGGEQ